MNARQIIIVIGIAVAGFVAALLISSSSGGTEPVAAGKKPAAADTLEVAGATVNAAAPGRRRPARAEGAQAEAQGDARADLLVRHDDHGAVERHDDGPVAAPTTATADRARRRRRRAARRPRRRTTTAGNGGFVQTGGED